MVAIALRMCVPLCLHEPKSNVLLGGIYKECKLGLKNSGAHLSKENHKDTGVQRYHL